MAKVAFWNVNTGDDSFRDRKNALATWCDGVFPDLLVLEEVSAALTDKIEGLTGMKAINHVNTRDRNFDPSTKQIWAFQREGMGFVGTAVRLQDLSAIRMCLKLVDPSSLITIYGIHANASQWGGINAVAAAADMVRSNPRSVVGGDFNCDSQYAANRNPSVVTPVCWDERPLQFSQWNKSYGELHTTTPNLPLHLEHENCGYLTIKPNKKGVIDFTMAGAQRHVNPIVNCDGESTWVRILKNFDHCPVVYDIT